MILNDFYFDDAISATCNALRWQYLGYDDTVNKIRARNRLYDARAEIAAVNEAMSDPAWRGKPRYNGCNEPCDNWNGPCVCGAWHKDGK